MYLNYVINFCHMILERSPLSSWISGSTSTDSKCDWISVMHFINDKLQEWVHWSLIVVVDSTFGPQLKWILQVTNVDIWRCATHVNSCNTIPTHTWFIAMQQPFHCVMWRIFQVMHLYNSQINILEMKQKCITSSFFKVSKQFRELQKWTFDSLEMYSMLFQHFPFGCWYSTLRLARP